MKLLGANASPYVAKVAMAAKHLGIEVELVSVDPKEGDARLAAANPINKIPCLVLENGEAVFDSRAITHTMDRLGSGGLYPAADPQLRRVERIEALCDGLLDAAVAHVYERRMRPDGKVHQPWLDRQWDKLQGCLNEFEKALPPLDNTADITTIGLGAALGYLDLRFHDEWRPGRESLIKWNEQFDATFPDLAVLKPSA